MHLCFLALPLAALFAKVGGGAVLSAALRAGLIMGRGAWAVSSHTHASLTPAHLQPRPHDLCPFIRWTTSRRAFNSIYERWCSQNQLIYQEVGAS
jgi:hypothetical protein